MDSEKDVMLRSFSEITGSEHEGEAKELISPSLRKDQEIKALKEELEQAH